LGLYSVWNMFLLYNMYYKLRIRLVYMYFLFYWVYSLLLSSYEYKCVLKPFKVFYFLFSLWRCCPTRARASSFLRLLDRTHWCTTVGRNPLDEWSARRRDLYLTTKHNKHPCSRQDSNPQSQQSHALDQAASGNGSKFLILNKMIKFTLEQTMKAQRGGRGIALLFL